MPCFRDLTFAAGLFAGALCCAGSAASQTATPSDPPAAKSDEPPPPPKRTVNASLSFSGEFGTPAKFKDASGDISVSRTEAKFGVAIPAGERGRLNLSLASEASFYSFDDATAFSPGIAEPWDEAYRHKLGFFYSRYATREISWFLAVNVASAGEAGAEFEDSITYGGFGGVNYALSDKLTVGLGVFARTQLEDDPTIFPIITLDWEIAPNLTLSNTAENGPGGQLAWKAMDDWTFSLGGEYAAREFRLDGEGAQPRGVGQDRRIRAYAGVSWNASAQVTLSGRIGIDFNQEYEIQDPNGNEVTQVDADPSGFLSLELKFKF